MNGAGQLLARERAVADLGATNRRSCLMADAKDFGRGRADPSLESPPSVGVMEDEIAKEILAIQLDSYGRAAATARAHVLDDLVVVLLDGLQLQPNEEFMITQGQANT